MWQQEKKDEELLKTAEHREAEDVDDEWWKEEGNVVGKGKRVGKVVSESSSRYDKKEAEL
jgi:hypothetical protein